jgi:hypothetical protein
VLLGSSTFTITDLISSAGLSLAYSARTSRSGGITCRWAEVKVGLGVREVQNAHSGSALVLGATWNSLHEEQAIWAVGVTKA